MAIDAAQACDAAGQRTKGDVTRDGDTTDRGDALELCDADGAAFAAYRYDAWGLPQGAGSYATGVWTQGTSLVNSTLAGQIASRQVLRYAAYAWDAESALYYCSARSYDPATRQWTTGDPAKADGEASAWQYCGGEPVGSRDPGGRKRLNVPHVRQSEDNWCGAASGRSIIKWYWPNRDWKANPSLANTTPTQAHFQEYAHGNAEDEPINTDEVRAGLWGWDVASHERAVNLITYADVKAEIDREEPMIIGTTTPLHWWVLCGYWKRDGVARIWLMNPRHGRYVSLKWKFFKNTLGADVLIRTSKWDLAIVATGAQPPERRARQRSAVVDSAMASVGGSEQTFLCEGRGGQPR